MDPSSKYWLKSCLDDFAHYLSMNPSEYGFYKHFADLGTFAHNYIHASGLFYGHAIGNMLEICDDAKTWTESDKFKIATTEGLCLAYLLSLKEEETKHKALEVIFTEGLRKIYDFYVLFTMTDSLNKKYRSIYTKNSDITDTVEQVIDNRISSPTMIKINFWKGSQFNIFAGIDVLFFALWLQGDYSYDNRQFLKKDIVTLMEHALHLNKNKSKNGENIINYFKIVGNIQYNDKKQAIDDIDFKQYAHKEHTAIRRLIYEYTAYICFSDSTLSVSDIIFLQDLSRKLGIPEDDSQTSLITIENFILQEGNDIFYLQYGDGINVIKQAFIQRFQDFVNKNKQKIITELLESKELAELLRKSRNEKLSVEEREKVKTQILDILKSIPSLAIFMMPGGAILLPIIYKIIPEEILMPSSFINKK